MKSRSVGSMSTPCTSAWWKTNSQSVDLVKLTSTPGYLGYTLLVEVGGNSNGRVSEVTRDGKIRWTVGNLRYPVDAIVLPGERVLVTEWDGQRVAEWDFKGNLIWKKDSFNGRPTNAQRLPIPAANFAATVYHGLPSDHLEPVFKAGSYLAFLGRISPEKRVDRAIEIAQRAGLPIKIAAKIDKADQAYFDAEIRHLFELPGVDYIGDWLLANM